MAQNTEHGGISIELEHIFPIIKKWLYSEKEIFLREIVSNACDAVTKLRRLVSLGQAHDLDLTDARITVRLDKDASTITVIDNGIGMTEEELRKYICQIALSGALDFIEKYEGEDAQNNGIIGHFGLGFYSSFMVSDTVDVITRSYLGTPAIKWTCRDNGEFDIDTDYEDEDGLIGEYGTAVVMHINDEGKEFLSEYKLKEVLAKYCAFMPVPIYFDSGECECDKEDHECGCGHDHSEHECTCGHDHHGEGECRCGHKKPINDTEPLWLKNPSDCTEEEYKEFYRKLFNDYREPLFYIHLKADYPLNFKGILYFPRITNEYDSLEGQVKLYYNQVFVADNIKEVIPEYLLMLKGVLDCPELPLNVSRSYLQNSGYVSKISAHIVKKVADKLNAMFNNDREAFEAIWRDIKTFVEYGCMKDRKFYDRVSGSLLLEKCGGGYVTVPEYLEGAKELHENKIYYSSDATAQSKYINMFKAQNIEVVLLDSIIDNQFITTVEMANEGVKFCRVDAEVADILKDDGDRSEIPAVSELFKSVVPEGTKVEFDRFKDTSTPALLNVTEESRRMSDMMKLYGMKEAGFPVEQTLILNHASSLVQKIAECCENGRNELAEKLARQVYSLSMLSQRQLTADELASFLNESYELLGMLS